MRGKEERRRIPYKTETLTMGLRTTTTQQPRGKDDGVDWGGNATIAAAQQEIGEREERERRRE